MHNSTQHALQSSKRLTVLVPTHDNDGLAFSRSALDEFEVFASRLAGGLTDLGVVRGLWWDGETLYRDVNHHYVANVAPARAGEIAERISEYIVIAFRQKAAYVELANAQLTVDVSAPSREEAFLADTRAYNTGRADGPGDSASASVQ